MQHTCIFCTAQVTESETACSGCLIAIQDKTPAALKPFLTYVLSHSTPELEWIGEGFTLYDRCAGGRIHQYKSLISGFQTAIDEPHETECGYYDSMVLVHEGLNSRVELSEDPQLGITVQMYIGCADGHPDIAARQCPACSTEYSADNPPSAQYNVCSYCAEDIELDMQEAYEAIHQIEQVANSQESFTEKRIWQSNMVFPWPHLSIPASFKDITFPKHRLACNGVHSRGLYLCERRRMLFVDAQSEGLSALIALPSAPVFNDPTFHQYVARQLQFVSEDLHSLIRLITRSGRQFAEEVLNQPDQFEVTMSPVELSFAAFKSLIPDWLKMVADGEWADDGGQVSLVVGLSEMTPTQVEYVSLICQHSDETKEKLAPLFSDRLPHCEHCGLDLVLGECVDCAEHTPSLRPAHNDFLNALPNYISVWLGALERHHMLAGVTCNHGALSIVAHRYAETENTAEVCLEYVAENFFCLESFAPQIDLMESSVPAPNQEVNGQYLSPDGKMKVEIHPMSITLFVYPTAMPSWCADAQSDHLRLAVL